MVNAKESEGVEESEVPVSTSKAIARGTAGITQETPKDALSGEYTLNENASTPNEPPAGSDYTAPVDSNKQPTNDDKTEDTYERSY